MPPFAYQPAWLESALHLSFSVNYSTHEMRAGNESRYIGFCHPEVNAMTTAIYLRIDGCAKPFPAAHDSANCLHAHNRDIILR
jgi:hypothetical protein